MLVGFRVGLHLRNDKSLESHKPVNTKLNTPATTRWVKIYTRYKVYRWSGHTAAFALSNANKIVIVYQSKFVSSILFY